METSGRTYLSLFANRGDASFVIDGKGHVRYLSLNGARHWLLSPGEGDYGPFYNFLAPEERSRWERLFHQSQSDAKLSCSGVLVAKIPDQENGSMGGHRFQSMAFDMECVSDSSETAALLVANFTSTVPEDIGETTSDARLRELVDNQDTAVLVEDQNRSIALVNQAFCDLFQIPVAPELLIGMDCSNAAEESAHHFEDPVGFVKRVELLLSERKKVTGERMALVSGASLERSYIPLFVEGDYKGHLWLYKKVTELPEELVEQRVREEEQKYRAIVENMELGIMEVDNDDRITKVFDRFCEMTGYKAEELLGQKAAEVFLVKEDEFIADEVIEQRKKGRSSAYECQLRMKSGEYRTFLISGAPIYRNDEVVGSIGIHYDITSIKETERALILAREEAEQAKASEETFLAGMSHEVRTPLHGILGMTEKLKMSGLTDDQAAMAKSISGAADVLHSMLQSMFAVTLMDRGLYEPEYNKVSLAETIEGLTQVFRDAAAEKGLMLTTELDLLPGKAIRFPRVALNQVLVHLLSNAIKYTEHGSVRLEVALTELKPEEGQLHLRVSDTGVGFKTEEKERIFGRFETGSSKNTRVPGVGLGLYLVQRVTEQLQGRLDVESTPGKGSSFHLQFKTALMNLDEKEMENRKEPNTPQLRVLVAEDAVLNQSYITSLLEHWGYAYDLAENGEEVLAKYAEGQHDLILMDLQMPVLDGWEATRRIRSVEREKKGKKALIVALTAFALAQDKIRAEVAGVDDYLTKPFREEDLRLMIEKHFQTVLGAEEARKGISSACRPDATEMQQRYEKVKQIYFAGQDTRLQMILKLFIEQSKGNLAIADDLIEAGERDQIRQLVHKLRPSLPMVGLDELYTMASELESYLSTESGSLSPSEKERSSNFFYELEACLPAIEGLLKTT